MKLFNKLSKMFREPSDHEWAAALATVGDYQTGNARPPVRYGEFRGQMARALAWKKVRGVWRSYWPDGCEQPGSISTGKHRCRSGWGEKEA